MAGVLSGVLSVLQVVRILEGRFGRLVLGDASGALSAQAHAEHLVLVKQGGADGSFAVAGRSAPFTRSELLMVNAGQGNETNWNVAILERVVQGVR